MEYLIWLGQKQDEYYTQGLYFENLDGWHLSRIDGRQDKHTLTCAFERGLPALQGYCDTHGLEYTIYPLDEVVAQKQTVRFDYWKVA